MRKTRFLALQNFGLRDIQHPKGKVWSFSWVRLVQPENKVVGQDYKSNCSWKRCAFPWLGWDSKFVGVSSLVHVSSSVATNRFRFVALDEVSTFVVTLHIHFNKFCELRNDVPCIWKDLLFGSVFKNNNERFQQQWIDFLGLKNMNSTTYRGISLERKHSLQKLLAHAIFSDEIERGDVLI